MELMVLVFLTSGLFLGWSLGANDAANVFGTAVGTRMVSFTKAALICSIFVVLGAVVSGSGAAHTLGKLGAINALQGAFMAALSAAMTVLFMTRAGLPVSTSQAIVGAIIGWNLYSGFPTDIGALSKIVLTWIACPLLAGFVAVFIYKGTVLFLGWVKPHLFRLDAYTRLALIIAGAFGSYSLGANNIANVMGVFVSSNPFTSFDLLSGIEFTGIHQLFLLGAIAIAVGIFTYSKKVMLTVGSGLMPLSPVTAWVVVIAHSIVLFLFASEGLEALLAGADLPTIPLVPVSSSQAVVGAVVGLGLLKGGRSINYKVLGGIASGWVTTPVIACALCFICLFFLQNVFNQQVYRSTQYELSSRVLNRLQSHQVPVVGLDKLSGQVFYGVKLFRAELEGNAVLTADEEALVLETAEISDLIITDKAIARIDLGVLSESQLKALKQLNNTAYRHSWMLASALSELDSSWRFLPDLTVNKSHNNKLRVSLNSIYGVARS